MPRLGGLLLVVTGAAFGAYTYLAASPDRVVEFAESARLAAVPVRQATYDDTAVRTFSPASPVFRDVLTSQVAPAAASTGDVKPSAWTTIVTAEQMEAAPLRSSKTNDPETRFELARDLQRELQRAGCYAGEITGAWSPATRRAMAAFLDRANATLPVNEPDYVLLALVRGHNDIVCSADCPSGQVADGDRCVPKAVVAQASKKSKRLEERRLAEARLAANQQQLAATEPERLPWLDRDGRPIVAQADPRAALPGRMSIGAPVVGAGAPPSSGTAPTTQWRQVTLETSPDDRAGSARSEIAEPPPAASKLAALAPRDGSDTDDASAVAPPDRTAVPLSIEEIPAHEPNAGGKSHSSRSEHRSSNYASAGHTRHGQPRPGTMRFNLMQSLGGIY